MVEFLLHPVKYSPSFEERSPAFLDGTDYFIGTDQLITRLDVLYGYLWVRPEWAVVVADIV